MNTIKNWYAVYTRPRWEKKTATRLSELEIETYCPVQPVIKLWSDRKKTVQEPLFASYCFVRIGNEFTRVRETPGVLNFVYWLGKPAVIREDEIQLIRRFLQDYTNVRTEQIQASVNDRVRVTSGLFADQEGQVLEVRNNTVKLTLPSLGVAMVAEVRKDRLALIS